MHTKWIMLGTIGTALAVTACGDDDGGTRPPNDTSGTGTVTTGPSGSTTGGGTTSPTNGPGNTGATGGTNTSSTSTTTGTTSTTTTGPVGSGDAGLQDGGDGSGTWSAADAAAMDGGLADDAGAAADGGSLLQFTDGEILAIVQTANSGEIAQGELAMEKALSPSVADYAEHMVMSHTMAQSEVDVVVMDSEIEPQANLFATNLENAAEQVLEHLTELPVATTEFDFAYMTAQVSQHTVMLETLRVQLIPQTDDPELVAVLETMEGEVAAHLELAEEIVEDLASPAP